MQIFLALDQRDLAQVVALRVNQIEEPAVHRRRLDQRRRRTVDVHAALQDAEVRASFGIERHDLAVEDGILGANQERQLTQFGVMRGDVAAITRDQPQLLPVDLRLDAHAVPLEFIYPARIAERRLARRRQHGLEVRRHLGPNGAFEYRWAGSGSLSWRQSGSDILNRSSRQRRLRVGLNVVAFDDGRIAMLNQQPLLRLLVARGSDQDEAAAQLHAEQYELDLPSFELLGCAEFALGLESARIPHNHRAGAVVAGRYDLFEGQVLLGMVFRPRRQTLVGRVERWPLRHGPAFQDAVNLKAQIVVQPARGVLLHDESALAHRPGVRAPSVSPKRRLRR